MIHNCDKEARPLDAMYALTNYDKTAPPVSRKADAFNKWRQSLPARCWNCRRFDSCTPGNRCNYNPARKLVKDRG